MDKEANRTRLLLLVPKKLRKKGDEEIIQKRLKDHFIKHHNMHKKDKMKIMEQGLFFAVLGIIVMFITTTILFKYDQKNMLSSFAIILLEPAGWFLFWEGLNLAIFESKKINPNLEFYEKMAKSRIKFEDG